MKKMHCFFHNLSYGTKFFTPNALQKNKVHVYGVIFFKDQAEA